MADVKSSEFVLSEAAAAVAAHMQTAVDSVLLPDPIPSPSAHAVHAHFARALESGAHSPTSAAAPSAAAAARRFSEAKPPPKMEPPKPVLSEKDQLIANLKAAMETDDYVAVFDALEAAEKKGLGEHKVAVEAQNKLALYMKQMETFEVLDNTVSSRNPKEIELALNLAEEYFLDKTAECRKIQVIRDTMQQMFRDLAYACRVDYASVDEQLKKMQAYGIDMKQEAVVTAQERRDVLFKQAKVIDGLKAATTNAGAALKVIQKKTNVIVAGAVTPASPRDAREVKTPTAGAKAPSHGRSASVGVPLDGAGADAAAGTPTAGGAVPPASPTSEKVALEVDSLLDENLSALEKVLREAKDMSIGASEAAYEAAKIKFAELQMEKKLVESSRGKKSGDDDAAEAKGGKGKSKREPGQEGDARIDPYNPKAGSLPPLEPEVYAIPKLALHNFPRLRTPEDFSRGVVFNRKRYQIGMLIWQQDKLERSMLRPTDEKKEVQYNLTAQKIFSNIQTFMGEKVPDKSLSGGVEACATEIMKLGYKNEELRDEIYVQVLKQITCHPKLDRAVVGWQLLGLVCEAFPPSPQLTPHVFHVMYPNTKPDVPVAPYAKYCMFTLWNTVNEPLKPITDFTLEHVRKIKRRKMVPGKVRIYFLDGSELDLWVEPHTRVCDSLKTIFDTIKLKERAGFGIFSVGTVDDAAGAEGREIWVPLNSCLLDYDPQPRPSVSPVLYKAQQARLVFKRRLYQDLTSPDTLVQKLLYYQTMVSICDEGLPCSEKQMHRFLALHRMVDQKLATTPVATANMLTAVAVKNILPHFVEAYSSSRLEKYLEKISQAKANLGNIKISWEVLINEVREWPLFGCSYFTAKPVATVEQSQTEAGRKKESDAPKGLMMGISSQGVFLVHGKDKKMSEEFPFFRIISFAIEPNNEHIVLNVRDKSDNKLNKNKWTQHRFKSSEAEEIFALLTTIQEDINAKTEVEN